MMVGVFGWLQHQFTWFRDVYDKTTDLPKMAFSSSLQDSFAVAILQNNCLRPLKYDPDFVYLLENLTCAHSPVMCSAKIITGYFVNVKNFKVFQINLPISGKIISTVTVHTLYYLYVEGLRSNDMFCLECPRILDFLSKN